jgi:hypothetical protein
MSATLNPNHADDTGILDGPAPNTFKDRPYRDADIVTDAAVIRTRGAYAIGLGTTCGRSVGPITAYAFSEAGLRQMRALIDRALGDRA